MDSVSDARAVSRQDYDVKKNAVQVADAQVKQFQAALDSARLNLDYTTISTSIGGRAGQRMVDVGNIVNANATALLVIQRMDPVYADFTVTEHDLSTVQRHLARGGLTVEVRLPEGPGEPRAGKLTFLDNAVQEGAGTVKLRATLDNRDRRFWPGRFAQVRLVLETQRAAVLVPAEAPQLSAKGTFVYVVKSDSSSELRPVKVGQRQGPLVVIEEGVRAGNKWR
jgi:multidrug efflux system membrane fusion protein